MLREFSILAIAMLATVANGKNLFTGGNIHPITIIPGGTSGGASGGTSGGISGSYDCFPSRRGNCNICDCARYNFGCTSIDCSTLPANVIKGNDVEDADLPDWPGFTAHATVGQVYKVPRGFCVRVNPMEHHCSMGP